MTYRISTEQTRTTGNITGIATVERLDRIVELLEMLLAGGIADVLRDMVREEIREHAENAPHLYPDGSRS